MARLQMADNTRVAPGQAVGPIVSAPRTNGGEVAAKQLQQAGAQIERTAGVASNIALDILQQQNETRVNDALNEAQAAALRQQAEYSQRRGANAMPTAEGLEGRPLAEHYTQRLGEELPEIGRRLGLNDVQMRAFQERSRPLQQSFRAGASAYELRQADAYEEQVYTSGVATHQQAAMENWRDPAAFSLALDNIGSLTTSRAFSQGATPEAAVLTMRENQGKAVLDIVTANADTAPRDMRDFLEQNERWMTPAQVEAARNAVGPGMAGIEAREWVGAQLSGAITLPGDPGSTVEAPLPGMTVEFAAPVEGARVSSDYGPRASFRTANGARASSNHDGVDFAAAAGTPVRVVAGGTVVRAGVNGGYGNFVEVRHPDGTVTGYGHLQGFNVKEGDVLARGQTLGRVGSTGNSSGPHLHLRARRDGESIDPATLFSGAPRAAREGVAAAAGPAGPTRADMIRRARAQFGENPVQLNAAVAEINTHFSLEDAAKRDAEAAARDSVYATIEAGGTPSASQLAALPPGMLNTVRNYQEAINAPPARRSDPDLLLAIAANPSAVENMTVEEIVAKYRGDLSDSDLRSVVGMSARAAEQGSNQLVQRAKDAEVVPGEAFSRVWTRSLDLRGIDRTPSGRTADDDRRALAQMSTAVRADILSEQQRLGRQLTEAEIETRVAANLGQLAWERPQGPLGQRYQQGFATSFRAMTPANRRSFETAERSRLGRDPSDDEVYAAYLRARIGGR